jgi:hypothetical protein
MMVSSWVAAQLAASQEGLSSMSERSSDHDMMLSNWFHVQLGRLGCHTSIRNEKECVRQHWGPSCTCAHGDSFWGSGEKLPSAQNVVWSRFQSHSSRIRRFVVWLPTFIFCTSVGDMRPSNPVFLSPCLIPLSSVFSLNCYYCYYYYQYYYCCCF